ncbi:MAG: haloacid dehalogenase type II [Rhodospirillaceae bacterium]|nr:haloacid dehalogenase type II [Rhodospirillaceae bacterium]
MIKALLFDVFGTVVNWRSGVIKDAEIIAKKYKLNFDLEEFADKWRAEYQPSMEKIRTGKRGFIKLDFLHLENLEKISKNFGLDIISNDDKSWLNKSWHRLPPWSDSKEGLLRLKSKFIIGAQSNGNISLIVNMSKISKLYWDVILGSEVVGHYKPEPSAYKKACEKLDLKTEECLMVAAHNDDLKGARNEGMKTAFVLRSKEHGNKQVSDLKPSQDWDYIVNDLHELADKLGCSKEGSF